MFLWQNGALWDTQRGAQAWRSDLSFDKCVFENSPGGRVSMKPLKSGSKAQVFSNSTMLKDKTGSGLSIEIGGNGKSFNAKLVLAQDLLSLDQQVYAAEIAVGPKLGVLDVLWADFKPFDRETTRPVPFPANALGLFIESLPASGVTIGPARIKK